METLAKQNKKIEKLNKIIITRTEEFTRNSDEFYFFINNAITRELHALTLQGNGTKKLSLQQFEYLMHDIQMMKDIIELIEKKQMADKEGYYYPTKYFSNEIS